MCFCPISVAHFYMLGYNIFERIAKEGRKYGFLLGISSQRPSEMSKTIISQCSNFIIHRIQNPDDLQYIARMVMTWVPWRVSSLASAVV